MAYNNAFNSYGQYPAAYPMMNSYAQPYGQAQPMQYGQVNSYTQQQQSQTGIIWVDGEVGAKAFQLPSGWPSNTPLPLWDTNDTVIYLKSTNPMGMPNPLQKIHYTMDEMQKTPMMQQSSGQAALPAPEQGNQEMTGYVTKDDFEKMKQEIRETLADAIGNTQNGQASTTTNRKGAKAE